MTGTTVEVTYENGIPNLNNVIIVWPNGTKYTGNFTKQSLGANGICDYANGEVYEGEWFNNMQHGVGVYRWPGGGKYEG
jgi:hypothetical protein